MKDKTVNTNRLVGMAILIAITVVLTVIASYIKFGPFSITLAMVPIVIGAVMYGVSGGAALGAVFGVVVLVFVINGVDAGAHILWVANPPVTAALCILKGAAAGCAAGWLYKLAAKKNTYAGVVSAALAAPLVNTSIFLIAMPLFFYDTLKLWAGETDILYFLIIGLTGFNFLLEIGVNAILSPGILRIIKAVKRA
jgi:uncharacterized membrane protein